MSVLSCHQLYKDYQNPGRNKQTTRVLNGISLAVNAGEFVSIIGPSGSGKSTLLYCLAGLTPITSGSVQILEEEISSLKRGALAQFRRDHLGIVFQSFCLIPSLNVEDNVSLPARLAKKHISSQKIKELLDQVGIADKLHERVQNLSGGQRQRVAIARVLASDPDIVFADEPTGALDSKSGKAVLDILQGLSREQGKTVVLVTHDLNAAARADRAVCLRDGVIETEVL